MDKNIFHLTAAALVCATGLRAEVAVSKVFGSNMVLQREKPVPVWGKAAPGEEVKVSFAGQDACRKGTKQGASGEDGLNVQKMLNGIYDSAAAGHEVAL